MRGWPPGELAGLVLVLVLALIPLYQFTSGRRPASEPVLLATVVAPTLDESNARLSIRFVHAPKHFVVLHEGKTLWEGGGAIQKQTSVFLPLEDPRLELQVKVEWPSGTPESVLELTLEPDELIGQSRTLWGNGQAEAILTFEWSP